MKREVATSEDGTEAPAGPGDAVFSVSVVVPTLDEAANIDELLERVLAAGEAAGLALEVIVVDDGSSDGTRERVRQWAERALVRLVARDHERGLSTAVLAGAREARGEVVVVIDGDLSHPPETVPELVGPVLAGDSDIAIGSRYVPGGSTPGWPWLRRFGSWSASALARLLTDARDPMSGLFAVRRDRLLDAGGRATGFKIGLEVLVRSGEEVRITEVPIEFLDRTHGRSKLDGRVVGEYLRQLVSLAGGPSSGAAQRGVLRAAGVLVALDIALFTAFLAAGLTLASAQLSSFVVGAALAFTILYRRRDTGGASFDLRIAPFVVAVLLAFFLRSTALGVLVYRLGWPAVWSISIASLLAGVFAAATWSIGALRDRADPASRRSSWRVVAVIVVPYFLLLRLFGAAQLELLPQEAYYWNYAQHIDIGYLDHPPMVAWCIWASTWIGSSEWLVRLPAILAWCVTLGFAYAFVRNIAGRGSGFRAALLVSVLPFFSLAGFFILPDGPLLACWAALLYFLERALLAERSRAWWGVGFALGLGLLSKYSIVLVPFAAFVFLLFDRRARRWLRSPLPYAAALLALAVFAPVLIWNAQHDWTSFTFQSSRRLAERDAEFFLPHFALYVLLLLTPVGVAAFVAAVRRVPAGAGASWGGGRLAGRARTFVLVFTLAPLAVFALASVWAETKIHWTGPIFLAALPALANSMRVPATALAGPRRASWMDRGWRATIAVLLVIYGGGLFYYPVFGIPGAAIQVNRLTDGWRDVGRKLRKIEDELERERGARPVVVGLDRYHTTSVLAFYVPRDGSQLGVVGRHVVLDRPALMYELWCEPEDLVDRDLIVVHPKRDELEDPALAARAERLGPVRELVATRHGRPMRSVYYRVLYGLRPADGG